MREFQLNKQIDLKEFKLLPINNSNLEHLNFLKKLFQNQEDKSVSFLGNLNNIHDKQAFIIENLENKKIGYLSLSIPTINHLGLSATSLYYLISPEYRNLGYATSLLNEIYQYLKSDIDIIILSIDKENKASRKVAEKNKFEIGFINDDEEEIIYIKYTSNKNKSK